MSTPCPATRPRHRIGVHHRDLPHQLSGVLVLGVDGAALGRGVEVLDLFDLTDDEAAVREDLVKADRNGAFDGPDATPVVDPPRQVRPFREDKVSRGLCK